MRDTLLKDKNYFEDFIKNKKQLVEESYSRLESGLIENKNLPDVNHRIFVSYLEILIASYSKNDEISSIRDKYVSVLNYMSKGWEDIKVKFQKGKPPKRIMLDKYFLMPYNYMIWMLSLAVLLKVSEKEVNILKKLIEDGNIHDELIISLLSFLTGRKLKDKTSKTTYKPFSFLIQSYDLIETEKKMKTYLDKWYHRTKLLMWHNYKPEPGKYYYFGRWSFEAAAVAVIKNLDDSSFKDSEYYPKDLVDYYRGKQ